MQGNYKPCKGAINLAIEPIPFTILDKLSQDHANRAINLASMLARWPTILARSCTWSLHDGCCSERSRNAFRRTVFGTFTLPGQLAVLMCPKSARAQAGRWQPVGERRCRAWSPQTCSARHSHLKYVATPHRNQVSTRRLRVADRTFSVFTA